MCRRRAERLEPAPAPVEPRSGGGPEAGAARHARRGVGGHALGRRAVQDARRARQRVRAVGGRGRADAASVCGRVERGGAAGQAQREALPVRPRHQVRVRGRQGHAQGNLAINALGIRRRRVGWRKSYIRTGLSDL